MSHEDGKKIDRIRQACEERDVDALREHAFTEGGLVEDALRRTAWPLLLGCDSDTTDQAFLETKELPPHRDEEQVELDVRRSFVYYPAAESEKRIDARKIELSQVIVAVLRRHPMLHYFQGYHDIVQVLLLVLGINAAGPAVARLSLLRIRDFMLPTMAGTESHLHLLPAILHCADRGLYEHLAQTLTQPIFALSATLTLYAHEIEEYGKISRLFDFLLASEAVVSVYLFTIIVISRKDELLEVEADEPDMLYFILSKLPKPLDLDGLIRRTVDLFNRYPPDKLPGLAWYSVSSNSVLKTTRNFSGLSQQTLQNGERFFEKEAAEIRRRDALKLKHRQFQALARRCRKPAVWTSAAVFTAVIAVYLRSYNLPYPFLGFQQRFFDLWRRFYL